MDELSETERIEKIQGGYLVRGANGEVLVYVYCRANESDSLEENVPHRGRGAAARHRCRETVRTDEARGVMGLEAASLFSRNTLPAKDLGELITWLRANPGKASAGVYSGGGRLISALFQKETGTQFNIIPYRGSPPALQDLMAGQIDIYLPGLPADLPLMRSGRIKG